MVKEHRVWSEIAWVQVPGQPLTTQVSGTSEDHHEDSMIKAWSILSEKELTI